MTNRNHSRYPIAEGLMSEMTSASMTATWGSKKIRILYLFRISVASFLSIDNKLGHHLLIYDNA